MKVCFISPQAVSDGYIYPDKNSDQEKLYKNIILFMGSATLISQYILYAA